MAINPDELEPPKKKAVLKDLTIMSVGELKEYIEELQTEIARAQEAINKKEAHRNAISGVFKT